MAGRPKSRAYKAARDKNRAELGVPDGKRIEMNKRKRSPAQVAAKAAGEPLIFAHPASAWKTFMAQYMNTCRIDMASKASGISRETAYMRRRNDPEFAKLFEEARAIAVGVMEDEGIRRAVKGVLEPVFYRGEEVGYVRKFSDGLLQFMLSNNDTRYRAKQEIDIGSKPGAEPPTINLTVTRPVAPKPDAKPKAAKK